MKQPATGSSTWKTGQRCSGVYFGHPFSGKISPQTRPMPCSRQVQFHVELDSTIEVFGTTRTSVIVVTGGNDDILYLE